MWHLQRQRDALHGQLSRLLHTQLSLLSSNLASQSKAGLTNRQQRILRDPKLLQLLLRLQPNLCKLANELTGHSVVRIALSRREEAETATFFRVDDVLSVVDGTDLEGVEGGRVELAGTFGDNAADLTVLELRVVGHEREG
jgi:hypothetical protein